LRKEQIVEGIERYLKVKHGVKLKDAKDYEIFTFSPKGIDMNNHG
jgi:starch phosphorylase